MKRSRSPLHGRPCVAHHRSSKIMLRVWVAGICWPFGAARIRPQPTPARRSLSSQSTCPCRMGSLGQASHRERTRETCVRKRILDQPVVSRWACGPTCFGQPDGTLPLSGLDATNHEHPNCSGQPLNPAEPDPGTRSIWCIRDGLLWRMRVGRLLLWSLLHAQTRHRLCRAISGAEAPLTSPLESGLLRPHQSKAAIHLEAGTGPDCMIFQLVPAGKVASGGTPMTGGYVDAGAGATTLGGVATRHHAGVGANAVAMVNAPEKWEIGRAHV